MDESNTSKDKAVEVAQTSEQTQSQPRKINILQLATWLSVATANNKGFLLKPNDLRMLYLFVLWEYLSKHHHQGAVTGDVPNITSDEQIAIPEADLVRMVQLMFHNTYYPYFSRVYNM